VSVCTASKVLSGNAGARFRPATIAAVQAAATTLGYHPDHRARALRTGRAGAIAVVCSPSHPGSHFAERMATSAQRALIDTGSMCVLMSGTGLVPAAIRMVEERRVDGLAWVVWGLAPDELQAVQALPLPVALVGRTAYPSDAPTIDCDMEAGAREAVAHLAQLGHRHIAWFGPEERCDSRRQAVLDACARHGLACTMLSVPWASFSVDSLRPLVEPIRRALPTRTWTALVAFNDHMALAAMGAARDAGLALPRDLSVVGFDDVLAGVSWPPLTTVSHMIESMMQEAVQQALDAARPRRRLIAPELIVRQSTAPPPG
jgi:LacI family transcriptional regulator